MKYFLFPTMISLWFGITDVFSFSSDFQTQRKKVLFNCRYGMTFSSTERYSNADGSGVTHILKDAIVVLNDGEIFATE